MSPEQNIRNLRERRAEMLDLADSESDYEKATALENQAAKLWDEIQLAESELLAKREDLHQAKLKGEL